MAEGFVTHTGGSRGRFWGGERRGIGRERSGRGCRVGRRVGVGYACLRFEVSSGAWEKQKANVSEAVMDMAAELLEVQAARATEQGLAYPPDTDWQHEFEAEFPYEPTVDQITGAEEIKQ